MENRKKNIKFDQNTTDEGKPWSQQHIIKIVNELLNKYILWLIGTGTNKQNEMKKESKTKCARAKSS